MPSLTRSAAHMHGFSDSELLSGEWGLLMRDWDSSKWGVLKLGFVASKVQSKQGTTAMESGSMQDWPCVHGHNV